MQTPLFGYKKDGEEFSRTVHPLDKHLKQYAGPLNLFIFSSDIVCSLSSVGYAKIISYILPCYKYQPSLNSENV